MKASELRPSELWKKTGGWCQSAMVKGVEGVEDGYLPISTLNRWSIPKIIERCGGIDKCRFCLTGILFHAFDSGHITNDQLQALLDRLCLDNTDRIKADQIDNVILDVIVDALIRWNDDRERTDGEVWTALLKAEKEVFDETK